MQTEYLTFIADFKVQGRFSYLSHQETLSFWQRVLVRAQVRLIYSQGFNPHPRLSLPLPRSVGVQSDCERLAALVAAEGFCGQRTGSAMAALLPDGCALTDVQTVPGRVASYPVSAVYRLTPAAPLYPARQEHLQDCLRSLQTDAPIILQRRLEKDRRRPIDIRPFLRALSIHGSVIEAVCEIRPAGTVRVEELMQWLGLDAADLAEPVRRTAVQWTSNIHHFQGDYHLS